MRWTHKVNVKKKAMEIKRRDQEKGYKEKGRG